MTDQATRERQIVDYVASQLQGATDFHLGSFRRMPEGWSRESYMFDLGWTDADGRREQHTLILRVDPPGSLIYSDRTLEYGVIDALHRVGYPVPRMWFLETGKEALGAPFLVMEKLEGTASPDVLYAESFAAEREKLGQEFIELLARLHTYDLDDLDFPPMERPTEETAADAAIDHWERTMLEQQLEPQPFLVEGFRWLRANKPVAPRISLLHGDYRSGNFLFEGDRITGIVDWELASLGDPLQDLGWIVMTLWKLDGKVCGFWDREELLRRYEAASGVPVDPDAMNWWEVWANMKLAVVGLTGTRTRVLNLADEINYSISHLYLPPLFDEMAKGMGI